MIAGTIVTPVRLCDAGNTHPAVLFWLHAELKRERSLWPEFGLILENLLSFQRDNL